MNVWFEAECSLLPFKPQRQGLSCLFDARRLRYLLRTSRKDLSPDDIWTTYITLTMVESGFRCLKSDLGLRPVFHQTEGRCEAHIWITILAYHLLHYIRYTLQKQGDSRSWNTIRRIINSHQYCTVVLPTVEGPVIHLRRPGVPDAEQKDIYRKLKINLKKLPLSKIVV